MSTTLTEYKRHYHTEPDAQQIQDCWNLLVNEDFIKETNMSKSSATEGASFEDCQHFIQHGVFATSSKMKSARERLQMSSLTLLLAFTAARPGDIIISHGYQHTDKCLKYRDIKFFAASVDGGHINLSAAIDIRHMKGLKNDPSSHRTQFVYQDPATLPPIYDLVLQLVIMGIMDDVFVDFKDIGNIYSIDFQKIRQKTDSITSGNKIVLDIKADKLDLPIFRSFSSEHLSNWITSPSEAWTVGMANQVLGRLRKLTGQPTFTFRAIRNACAGQLKNYKITDIDMKNAIGHRKGTPTYAKHYRSKRSSVDLQGLVTDGNEDRQRIKPPPKSYVPPVQLLPKDMDELYNNANLIQLKSDHQQVSVAYKFLHVQSMKYPSFLSLI
jgi:hypothetical protein